MSAVLVPHARSSVRDVRAALAHDLRGRGVPRHVVDDAVLVVSEILSNAVKHAQPLPSGGIRVEWDVDGDDVELRICDGGSSTQPRAGSPSAAATGGRGLGIVAEIVAEWGVVERTDGSTVWARLGGRRDEGPAVTGAMGRAGPH